jgi:two-component system, OmpR family, heavy metal sensor histidine kinase CusS
MSSKTGARAWSLATRLAWWHAASAAALVLTTTASLYLLIAAKLDREADEQLVWAAEELEREFTGGGGRIADPESWAGFYARVVDGGEGVRFQTTLAEKYLPRPVAPDPGGSGAEFLAANGHWLRPYARRTAAGVAFEVAADRTPDHELLATYRSGVWVVLLPLLAAGAAGGYAIARRGIRPVGEIAATARRIGPSRMGERIDVKGLPAELRDLAGTFNGMLDRLQESFDRLGRFSADIAHELRTPVHRLRNVAEVALGQARSPHGDAEALGVCLRDGERLTELIDRLLFLARAEDPRCHVERVDADMAREVETVREFFEAAAIEAGIDLAVEAPPGLRCSLDRALFQRALGNLVANAVGHTPPGGRVTIAASPEAGGVRVAVEDTGCGIPAEALPHLFDRFYRPDRARTPGQGVGLGLAIVRGIAELHGGRATASSTPGRGSTFALWLPGAGGEMTGM